MSPGAVLHNRNSELLVPHAMARKGHFITRPRHVRVLLGETTVPFVDQNDLTAEKRRLRTVEHGVMTNADGGEIAGVIGHYVKRTAVNHLDAR